MDGLRAFGKIFDFSSGPCFVKEREREKEGCAHKVPEPSIHGFEGGSMRKKGHPATPGISRKS